MQRIETVELYHQTFHCSSSSYHRYNSNCSLSSVLCFLSFKTYVELILTPLRWWFYFSIVFRKSRKSVRWKSYLQFQFPVCFCFAFELTEFRYYCFGNLMTEIVKRTSSLYHNTLIKCTHLIRNLHLEDITCIAILFAKMQNLVTRLKWK